MTGHPTHVCSYDWQHFRDNVFPCSIPDAVRAHPRADVFINFASMRRSVPNVVTPVRVLRALAGSRTVLCCSAYHAAFWLPSRF